jgi:hypothetical protein
MRQTIIINDQIHIGFQASSSQPVRFFIQSSNEQIITQLEVKITERYQIAKENFSSWTRGRYARQEAETLIANYPPLGIERTTWNEWPKLLMSFQKWPLDQSAASWGKYFLTLVMYQYKIDSSPADTVFIQLDREKVFQNYESAQELYVVTAFDKEWVEE